MADRISIARLTLDPRLPLVCQWNEIDAPLPRRRIRAPGRRKLDRTTDTQAFDFCAHIARLAADIVGRCGEFSHVNMSQILFGVTQARNRHAHGLQARVTPLRFRNGELTRRRRGVNYQVQRFLVGQHDILYVITFCLPRFIDLDFDEKLVTLFHELYHISPEFDGDLRRHDGRYEIHSHSKRRYDEHMASMAKAYLADGADHRLAEFLHLNFAQLQARYGAIVGAVIPRPKIVPVTDC